MKYDEALKLAQALSAWGERGILLARISADGDQIVFGGTGAKTGTHGLDINSSSRDRVLAHWRGFVTNNGGTLPVEPTPPPPPVKTPAAQLNREIAESLRRPLRPPTPFDDDRTTDSSPFLDALLARRQPAQQHVRRMAVVTYWGDPQTKAGGKQQLVEFTRSTGDRDARAWNASSRRFNKYMIDTQLKGEIFKGSVLPDGSIDPRNPARAEPDWGVKSLRPATLKDLKRFHFKLPEGHTLAESPELEAERANNCMYCGKPTRKGSALIDGQTAHKSCIKEFES
jgi:hypothetical protein